MKLLAVLLLLDINKKLDQLIAAKGEIVQNLEDLKTSVGRLVREVGETFTTVITAIEELKARLPDPGDQAVIDNLAATLNAKAQELDDFQRQLSTPEPTPEPTPE